MTPILIEIPFDPVAWAAPKLGRGWAYDPREKDKRAIRFLIGEQYPHAGLLEGYIQLKFKFICQPPKSASNKNKLLMLSGEIVPTKSDLTNYQKLYEDCLKGIIFKDDRNVEIISSQKLYGEKGKVLIEITNRCKL